MQGSALLDWSMFHFYHILQTSRRRPQRVRQAQAGSPHLSLSATGIVLRLRETELLPLPVTTLLDHTKSRSLFAVLNRVTTDRSDAGVAAFNCFGDPAAALSFFGWVKTLVAADCAAFLAPPCPRCRSGTQPSQLSSSPVVRLLPMPSPARVASSSAAIARKFTAAGLALAVTAVLALLLLRAHPLATPPLLRPDASQPQAPGAATASAALGKDDEVDYTSATRPASLAATIDALRREWRVPGLAAAVVRRGRVVFARGFGRKHLHRAHLDAPDADGPDVEAAGAAVSQHTLFQIGSVTKAFTSMLVGMAVDDGQLAWRDRLASRCAGLRLPDPIAQEYATVVDALAHKTGLPDHYLMRLAHADFPSILAGLPHLTQSLEFRQEYHYSNLPYGIISEVLRNATGGIAWEDLLRSRIFEPLGMARTVAPLSASEGVEDVARGFSSRGDEFPESLTYTLENVRAAGSIVSSATDMSKWLAFILNGGRLRNGTALISNESFKMLVSPQVTVPYVWDGSNPTYALGWEVDTFRGKTRVWHNGGMIGFRSSIVTFPDDDLGIVVLANKMGTQAAEVIADVIADWFLFPNDPVDWSAIRHSKDRENELDRRLRDLDLLARRNPAAPPARPHLRADPGPFAPPAEGRRDMPRPDGGLGRLAP
ncbi:hypothetical protein HK405_003900, partial [Cladochytrium tenue]